MKKFVLLCFLMTVQAACGQQQPFKFNFQSEMQLPF